MQEFDQSAQTGVTANQLLAMMMESQFWPAAKMLDYQRLQLTQLLVHARQTTAFYKHRLSPIFNDDGSVNFSRWRDVPILTRKDLQHHRPEMLSDAVPESHGPHNTVSTSGSSGQNINVELTALASTVSASAWRRFHSWHGLNLDTGWTQIKAYKSDGTLMTTHIHRQYNDSGSSCLTLIKRNLTTKQKLAYLRSTKTNILMDFSNHAELLARENLRSKNPVRLSAFIGYGMQITPQQEALINESFGAKTLSPYSSEESMLMACQCGDQRQNFHICSELSIVEVLDENGKEVPVGQPGRMITTPLFSSAQPLIRYDQGDIVVRGPPCPCGRTLPVISEIRGRKDAIFQFPGRQVSMNKFDDELVQTALNSDAYQFAQTAPELIVVRYVAPKLANLESQDIVRQHILEMLNTKVNIAFERVQSIPANAGGKPQRVTREF